MALTCSILHIRALLFATCYGFQVGCCRCSHISKRCFMLSNTKSNVGSAVVLYNKKRTLLIFIDTQQLDLSYGFIIFIFIWKLNLSKKVKKIMEQILLLHISCYQCIQGVWNHRKFTHLYVPFFTIFPNSIQTFLRMINYKRALLWGLVVDKIVYFSKKYRFLKPANLFNIMF